ncbi:hypothetical protein BCY90_15820 [Agrobacterium deltaense]|uniref:class I SAM-dependent methyltransferase n=1 Tax=Agrobacterium TaxID=357 RepID=UPI00075DFEAF|nr:MULTISPECIES: methyltransferase domain-containing protein [Agrobacterium]RKF41780.1 hypothetical protein BCY90_15820 [Agrobacterium deltaense]
MRRGSVLPSIGIPRVSHHRIDPAESLIREARRLDPEGDYRTDGAERLPFEDGVLELVVAYLSLIDIADVKQAINEMNRVLWPGGHLLIANLNSFWSAAHPTGWRNDADGHPRFMIDHYMDERPRLDWLGQASCPELAPAA